MGCSSIRPTWRDTNREVGKHVTSPSLLPRPSRTGAAGEDASRTLPRLHDLVKLFEPRNEAWFHPTLSESAPYGRSNEFSLGRTRQRKGTTVSAAISTDVAGSYVRLLQLSHAMICVSFYFDRGLLRELVMSCRVCCLRNGCDVVGLSKFQLIKLNLCYRKIKKNSATRHIQTIIILYCIITTILCLTWHLFFTLSSPNAPKVEPRQTIAISVRFHNSQSYNSTDYA